MADLGSLIYRALTGYSPRSEPTTTAGQLAYIRSHYASTTAMAKAMGMPRRTVSDWIAGKHAPSRGYQAGIRAMARYFRMSPLRRQKMISRNSPNAKGIVEYDSRNRRIDARAMKWSNLGLANLINAYLNGATLREMEDTFIAQIGEPFWREAIDLGRDNEIRAGDRVGLTVESMQFDPYKQAT